MTLIDITLLNLRRRKTRAAFVLAGLAIGVAAVVALVSLFRAMSQGILHEMEKYGANILVVPRSDSLPLTYAGMDLGGVSFRVEEIRQENVDRIRTIPSAKDLAAVGPVLLGTVDAGGNQVVLAGFDLAETKVLKPWWKVDGRMPGPAEVMLGAAAARKLELAPGGQLRIDGGSYPVTGILAETGSLDDNLVIAPLETARAILKRPGAVSMVEVAAHCADCPIEAIMAEIGRVLPTTSVTAIKQVVASRMAAMEQFEGFLVGVSAILLLVGGLVVFVTVTASVRERTSEIGIFRAIGFRRSAIMGIFLGEAAILSALAGVAGYGAGLGGARLMAPLFKGGAQAAWAFDPMLPLAAVALSILLGQLASLVPAIQASRLDPATALRTL
jgi:putative ABC transport system permease protein